MKKSGFVCLRTRWLCDILLVVEEAIENKGIIFGNFHYGNMKKK